MQMNCKRRGEKELVQRLFSGEIRNLSLGVTSKHRTRSQIGIVVLSSSRGRRPERSRHARSVKR